jgi:hypothetical protein
MADCLGIATHARCEDEVALELNLLWSLLFHAMCEAA